ncbi:MAG: amino acid ABC transporter permease [Acetobacteraceae bacterium]
MEGWWADLTAGFVTTLELAGLASAGTLLIALVLALARVSSRRWLRTLATAYVELMRGVPVLAILILVYFGLGSLLVKLGINGFWMAVIILAFNEGAYASEVYRAALQSVQAGQWRAARSLGLGRAKIMRLVILPQAIPPAIPPTINEVIYLIKASALASLVGVNELTANAQVLISETFRPLDVLLFVSGLYLAIVVPLAYLGRFGEYLLARSHAVVRIAEPRRPFADWFGRVKAD